MTKAILAMLVGLGVALAAPHGAQAMTLDSIVSKAQERTLAAGQSKLDSAINSGTSSLAGKAGFGGQVLGEGANYTKKMTDIKGLLKTNATASVAKAKDSLKKQATAMTDAWKKQATSAIASLKSNVISGLKSAIKGKIKGVLGG